LSSNNVVILGCRRHLAKRGVRMPLPGRPELRSRDKDRLPALCAQAGVATPRVRQVSDARFFERCTSEEEGGWNPKRPSRSVVTARVSLPVFRHELSPWPPASARAGR